MMTRQNDIPLNEANNNTAKSEGKEVTNPVKPSTDAKMPALIPLWDVANHANGTITTNYNPAEELVEGATMTDIKKDEQIFIYYGNRNNANLLIHNGYEILF